MLNNARFQQYAIFLEWNKLQINYNSFAKQTEQKSCNLNDDDDDDDDKIK